jgi:hypothetical protein
MAHQSVAFDARPAAVLSSIVHGFRGTQALLVATELGIADHLTSGPLSAAELAMRTATNADALRRLMRALCALGVFTEQASGCFAHNSVSRLLCNNIDDSFSAIVQFLASPARWRCWGSLGDTIRTGEGATERVLGAPLFDYYAAHPAHSKIHDDAMKAMSLDHGSAIVNAIALRTGDVVVDVGGGTGQLLAAIMAANAAANGILFDLPGVVAHAPALLNACHVLDRCTITSGSFFDDVPDGGDVYVLKQVIHDWDDDRATTILRNCRRAMPQSARLLVVERQMPEPGATDVSAAPFLVDLEMLVMTPGGRERTQMEIRTLLANSGFTLHQVTQTASPFCVFEAHPG